MAPDHRSEIEPNDHAGHLEQKPTDIRDLRFNLRPGMGWEPCTVHKVSDYRQDLGDLGTPRETRSVPDLPYLTFL
jgi:hypothetical protein